MRFLPILVLIWGCVCAQEIELKKPKYKDEKVKEEYTSWSTPTAGEKKQFVDKVYKLVTVPYSTKYPDGTVFSGTMVCRYKTAGEAKQITDPDDERTADEKAYLKEDWSEQINLPQNMMNPVVGQDKKFEFRVPSLGIYRMVVSYDPFFQSSREITEKYNQRKEFSMYFTVGTPQEILMQMDQDVNDFKRIIEECMDLIERMEKISKDDSIKMSESFTADLDKIRIKFEPTAQNRVLPVTAQWLLTLMDEVHRMAQGIRTLKEFQSSAKTGSDKPTKFKGVHSDSGADPPPVSNSGFVMDFTYIRWRVKKIYALMIREAVFYQLKLMRYIDEGKLWEKKEIDKAIAIMKSIVEKVTACDDREKPLVTPLLQLEKKRKYSPEILDDCEQWLTGTLKPEQMDALSAELDKIEARMILGERPADEPRTDEEKKEEEMNKEKEKKDKENKDEKKDEKGKPGGGGGG